MSSQDLFVDGILNVTLVKGVVRLDLYSLSATNYKDGQPQPEFRQRLVMNPQVLLGFQRDIQGAIDALRERGLMPMPPGVGGPQMSVALAAERETATEVVPAPQAAPAADPPPPMTAPSPPPAPPAPERKPPRSRNFPSLMES